MSRKERQKRLEAKFPIIRDCEGKSIKCQAPGCKRCARHIHHIKARCEGGTDEPENLMPLCDKCHRAIHKKQGDWPRWGRDGGKKAAAGGRIFRNLVQFQGPDGEARYEDFMQKRAEKMMGIAEQY